MRFLALATLLVVLLAGCAAPGAPGAVSEGADALAPVAVVDPLAVGPLSFGTAPYDAGETTVGGPDVEHSDYEYDARLRGQAWWPEAPGSYPVLVFLHGQHSTCGTLGEEMLTVVNVDSCDDEEGINTAYPSHLGYAYLGERLASHGYVVVSMLAHEINRMNGGDEIGMWARGELSLATLDAIRAGTEGMPAEVVERADLSRVGLMGHSRGGEGVVAASHVNAARPEEDRHALKGIVALAPTDFNERAVEGIAFLALVPYCDGDVSTLHGLRTFDHSRWLDNATPKVQVLVRGTNHNYYNSRWYDETGTPVRPGDDAAFNVLQTTGSCGRERDLGGWRWTPGETEQESIAHVGGFLRWTVGGEAGLAPFFTGGLALPDAACPDASSPCDDEIVVSAVLPGARPLVVVNGSVPADLALAGFDDAVACAGSDCAPNLYSSADALRVAWTQEATATLALPAPQDWRSFDVLSFRAAALAADGPTLPDYGVRVEIEDASGSVATVDAREVSTALEPTPDPRVDTQITGAGVSKLALQSVRVPLAGLAIDLGAVQQVRLVFEGEGRAVFTDLLVQAEPDVLA